MKCQLCLTEMLLLSPAPEAAWPLSFVCFECRDELADDDDYRDGPECDVCRDGFCNSCV